MRGYFSYITESLINLTYLLENNDREIIYYHDLNNIPGYGVGNIFDICFKQNSNDYFNNKNEYIDIEKVQKKSFDVYDLNSLGDNFRTLTEKVVKKYFILKEEYVKLFDDRIKDLDFKNIIGVHRRSTDIRFHMPVVPLENIFYEIDNSSYSHIFLMCDNLIDYEKFKEKYGDKLICFDNYLSKNSFLPFFKNKNTEDDIKNHIIELIFGVLTLSKVKYFICSRSNISSFVILSNSELKYKIL